MFVIEDELKKLPGQPGVYLMHDDKDEIIYVGKAKSLKNRVRQYFQESYNKSPKITKMVSKIVRFEYIVTDSELEALVLENNLIKEHRPRYNTMLTDDKTYPFIKVTVGEDYPRILFSRQMKKDRSRYFGPFTDVTAVRDTIELIHKLYRVRNCNKKLPEEIGKDRPCLYHQMHQCDAPCQAYISKEDYRSQIDQVVEFLDGNYEPVLTWLHEKMMKCSDEMDFEKAIEYRELINSVRKTAEKQKITNQDMDDRDVVAMAKDDRDVVVQVFYIREGRLIGREHFQLQAALDDTNAEILNSFIKQFYSGTPFVPHEILVQEEIPDAELVAKYLTEKRKKKVKFVFPKKGIKEKMVELAKKNAKMVLEQDRERIKREELRTIGAMNQIGEWIGIGRVKRVEAFDISNISGFESVGSMVVFEDGRPKKNDYRRFKIRTVIGPNDYASMREVLTRRFSHGKEELEQLENEGKDASYGSFTRFPDLLMMDGGRGQVNIALEVLQELKVNIPVCGMVKDDNHRTRGLYYNNVEIPIDRHSEGFKLITRIQDEAHRFAIEYHRSLRSKEQVHSILDDIEGIGPARRRELMRYFKTIEAVRDASVEDIMGAPKMNRAAAESVYLFFHKNTEK